MYHSFRCDVFYSILIEVGVCMQPVGVIKMCLNETYTRVPVGKILYDMCLIRNCLNERGALSPLLFTFDLEHANRLACNCMVNISCVMLMMLI
jgi:hypothetical protein